MITLFFKKIIFIVFICLLCLFFDISGEFSDKRVYAYSFNTKYDQESLPLNKLPKVIESHPRLFLRTKPWKHGPDLETLRASKDEKPLKDFLHNKPWDPKPGIEWAFRYLLTEDETLVAPIIETMKNFKEYWPGYLTTLAVMYDWVSNSPNFNASDRKIIEEKIKLFAEKAISYGEEYQDMWSHFGYRPVLDIAAAGLVLYGHKDEEAKRYIAIAGGYMKNNFFPAWQLNDGAYQGGWNYYSQGPANLFKLVAIWSSATDEDLYEIIRKEYGDWLISHLNFLIYTMYPDHSPVDSCGFGYTPDQKGGTNILLMLTRAYLDPEGAQHLRWRNEWGWRLGIDQFLYHFKELNEDRVVKQNLPLSKCWGRQGVGYVQMRSGWEKDDTVIEFKCGDYFWSHQSNNQNSFTIYKKGRLAIQSGLFGGGYWGDHMLYYYRPTIGSNSILINKADEVTWVPSDKAKNEGVSNNKGYIKENGGQRSCYIHPEFGSAETCFTFEKYRYRKNNQHYFETGDLKAFEINERYSYVYGDATMAYNNPVYSSPGNKPKIDFYTRQLAFLDKKYVVIFDRVNSVAPDYEKRWILHSVGEPAMQESTPINVEYPRHIETYGAGAVSLENGGGRLYCQTLFPNDYVMKKIGGGPTISDIQSDKKNKGDANLIASITGSFKNVSETISTDQGKIEQWVIEFIDSNHFSAKGSVTGEDGIGSLSGGGSEMFISNSGALFIPRKNWTGIPAAGDKFYFSVLSPSFRFWDDGKNHSLGTKGFVQIIKDGSPIEPGYWRIEVIPKQPKQFDIFLHFLYPCDRDDTTSLPKAHEVESLNKAFKGIKINNWVVLFQAQDKYQGHTRYRIESEGSLDHLILGLKAGAIYSISINGQNISGSDGKIKASENGSILFSSKAPCDVELSSY